MILSPQPPAPLGATPFLSVDSHVTRGAGPLGSRNTSRVIFSLEVGLFLSVAEHYSSTMDPPGAVVG